MSTLKFYRMALKLRRQFVSDDENMTWVPHLFNKNVLHFKRKGREPGVWHSITNFGEKAVKLPSKQVMMSSQPIENGLLPANATAWLWVAS